MSVADTTVCAMAPLPPQIAWVAAAWQEEVKRKLNATPSQGSQHSGSEQVVLDGASGMPRRASNASTSTSSESPRIQWPVMSPVSVTPEHTPRFESLPIGSEALSGLSSVPSTPEFSPRELPSQPQMAGMKLFSTRSPSQVQQNCPIQDMGGNQSVSQEVPPAWYRVAYCGGISVREAPDVESQCTGTSFKCGDVFAVLDKVVGIDQRIYLKLANQYGWVFDDSMLFPEDPSVLQLQPSQGQDTFCSNLSFLATNPKGSDKQEQQQQEQQQQLQQQQRRQLRHRLRLLRRQRPMN